MIQDQDEGTHPFPSGFDAWNESLFFDWIGPDGTRAGHCRIGVHPALGTVWFWFYVLHEGHWACINKTALPYSGDYGETWAQELDGLRFCRRVVHALQTNVLEVQGVGTWIDGPRAGQSVALGVHLTFEAAGPAHGMAARTIPWTDGVTYHAARYEQPCDVTGTVTVDGAPASFTGKGERDHSWGPRFWAMGWTFMVLAVDRVRAQRTEVDIEGMDPIVVGYIQKQEMEALESVSFDLVYRPESEVHVPFDGSMSAQSQSYSLAGTVTPVTGVAIDDSHCLPDEARSIYRRSPHASPRGWHSGTVGMDGNPSGV